MLGQSNAAPQSYDNIPTRRLPPSFTVSVLAPTRESIKERWQWLMPNRPFVSIRPLHPGYIARGTLHDNDKLAIQDFAEALRRDPKNRVAYVDRGVGYDRIGDSDHAIADYTEAIRQGLVNGYAQLYRARLYSQKHNFRAALSDLEIALKRMQRDSNREHYPEVLNDMAWLKAVCPDATFRDGKKAVELATKACELNKWEEPTYIDTLAAACAECGDFDQAIKYQTQAVNIKEPEKGYSQKERNSMEEKRRQRLRLYQNHKPYRDDFKRFDQ